MKKDYLLIFLVGISCLIIGLVVASNLDLTAIGWTQDEETDIDKSLDELSQAYASAASEIIPSVVNIDVEVTYTSKVPYFDFSPFGDDFFDDFFKGPFGGFPREEEPWQEREYKSFGQGSGVIVSEDGYIITNNHVVQDADKITVRLFDGRDLEAEIIGTDPKTDIAVIKIEGDDLPVAKLGDSDDLKVGNIVLAIGHPLRQSHTVTAGIISAVGRSQTGLAEYEDFIQTDAAINPGNSGGPLINLDGEVVGINTAIASYTGGYMGIGFSIPINMAKDVMSQLIEEGRVVRGYLGVYIQDLTQDIAEKMDLEGEEGVLVADIVEDSPADKGGLEDGDLIISFDGKEVEDANQLKMMVAKTEPGKRIDLKIIRDGDVTRKRVVIDELEAETEMLSGFEGEEETTKNYIGIEVQELDARIAGQLGYEGDEGVVIVSVAEGSPAYYAGLQRGDIILEVNDNEIEDLGDFNKHIDKAKEDDCILFHIWSSKTQASRFVIVNL